MTAIAKAIIAQASSKRKGRKIATPVRICCLLVPQSQLYISSLFYIFVIFCFQILLIMFEQVLQIALVFTSISMLTYISSYLHKQFHFILLLVNIFSYYFIVITRSEVLPSQYAEEVVVMPFPGQSSLKQTSGKGHMTIFTGHLKRTPLLETPKS